MKRLLVTVAASAFVAVPAFAAESLDTESVEITGTVAKACAIEAPGALVIGAIPINPTAGESALTISEAKASPVSEKWVSCNTNTRLDISAANQGRGLESPTLASVTVPANFVKSIPYTLRGVTNVMNHGGKGTWNGAPSSGASWWGYASVPIRPFHAQAPWQAQIKSELVGVARPLAADDYQDTVTVTLSAV